MIPALPGSGEGPWHGHHSGRGKIDHMMRGETSEYLF